MADDPAAERIARGDAALIDRLMRDPRIALPDADTRTGAPASVRAAVGAAPTPRDRLATLRSRFPDARPFGDNNFVYTHPQSGRQTLYNPQGLDWGDLASVGPEIGEFLGGTMGGVAALPVAVGGAPATGGLSALAVPAGVGLGAAAGREAVTAAARFFGGTRDTRGMPERLGDTATTAGLNAAGVPIGNALAQGARWALGPVRRAMGPVTGPHALQDFAGAGVPPMAGAATGSRTTQLLEAGLEATPGGAAVISGAREAQAGAMGQSVRSTAAGFGTAADPVRVGGILREGADGAAQRFSQRQEELYERAFSLVPAGTRAPLPSVERVGRAALAELSQAQESRSGVLQPVLNRVEAMLNDAGAAGLSFDAVRAVRTDLGRILGAPRTATESPSSATRPYLERLYAALSDDMHAAIRNPAAPWRERALRLADRYTRFNQTQNLEPVRRILESNTDEQVFRMVFPQNGRPDPQALARFRRNMTPEEWGAVQATVLDRMGMPTAGVSAGENFSVNTFLTNWNRLTQNGEGARNALFGGSQGQQLGTELDRLVRVAQRIRDGNSQRNWSGTARVAGMGIGIYEGGGDAMRGDWGGVATVVGLGMIAPRYAAQLLTNPATVRWLAGATPAMQNDTSRRAALTRLAAIAEVNPEIREAAHAFQQTFNPATPTPQRR